MDLHSVFCKSPEIITRKTGTEYVLVPLANNIADMNSVFTLNETGAFIWEQIDGETSLEEIISSLTAHYDIDNETARKDVLSLMERMSNYLIIKK